MNRDSRKPGWGADSLSVQKLKHRKLVGLEPLEERKLLAAVTYYNDNWTIVAGYGPTLDVGDQVRSNLDSGTTVTAEYGFDAFGTTNTGESVSGYETIHSAIQNTESGGTLNLLPGTFKESDIVIDRPMTMIGRVVSGVRTAVIVPEVTSAKSEGQFPVGTHSGIIINSANVTIDSLQIDGNGNGALGTSMHFHHGITNIFDTQGGGNYASVRAGNLAPNNLSADDADANIRIRNLDVRNTYWHGITLSGTTATNMAANRIQNVTVQNVGAPGARDVHRVGIQVMNQIETDILNSTISNVGVGIETTTFGTLSFDSNDAARNNSGVRMNTVTDADQRAYSVINSDGAIDLNFVITLGATFIGFDANKAIYSNTSNNGIGLYINNSQTVVAGLETQNAKIGMKVENTRVDGLRLPVITGSTIVGPGTGVNGSIGIMADNVGDPTNPASFGVAGSTKVTGFQTGIRLNQENHPNPPSERNRAQIDRVNLAGNGTAISVGNNSLLQGNTNINDAVALTGNGTIEPGFPDSFVMREGPDNWAGPYADVFKTGSVTLNSSATLDMRLAGDTGSAPVFNFNENIGTLPFGLIPAAPEDGRVRDPYGSSFGANTKLENGVLTISGLNGTPSVALAYGTLAHPDPNDPTWYITDPMDLSQNYSKMDIIVKLGASNQAKAFIFGLVDTEGQVALFTITTEGLSTTTYSTVSINLAAPGIPFSLGSGGDFDLNKVMGWAVLGDVGLINGATNVPIHVILDQVNFGSILNSQLNVTGTVNLAGAKLNLQLGENFTPSVGQQFTIINNDGADPIQGQFAQGSQITIGGLTYSINYAGGDGNDVVLTRTASPTTSVVGRHLFYNQSKFDGNSAAINASDDNAIATDKVALRFTGSTTAPISAASSYSRGINGIMVDVAGAAGTLTVNDFTFKVGTTGTVSSWTAAPAPTGFSVRAGAGVGGSDRVEIIWANNAIANKWLQVIVEGNDTVGGNNTNTGLANSDVFFFASKVGDTFESTPPALFSTGAADALAARNHPGALQPITNIYDFDRNQTVGAGDELVARNAGGTLTRNLTWNPPAGDSDGDGDGNVIASALAAKSSSSLPAVPGWISHRLASVDLNSGPVARLFTALAEANNPTTRSLLQAANEVTNALDLDDSLLESLIAGLN